MSSHTFTTEQHLQDLLSTEIVPFWQNSVAESTFVNEQGYTLHYAYYLHPDPIAAIVLLPGRAECYLKYQELIYDFAQNGYSVFILDHQGQGYSQRLLDDPQKGYVADFKDYITDLKQFYDEVVVNNILTKVALVAHSMGGTVALGYLQKYPSDFAATVLSAPMLGIANGSLSNTLVKGVAQGLIIFHRLFNRSERYFVTQGRYQPLSFSENKLTLSHIRYQVIQQLYEQYPELALGGITYQWLDAAFNAIEQLFTIQFTPHPLLLLQAQGDTIVDNQAQQTFINQKMPQAKLITFPQAKHELFFAEDHDRQQALEQTLLFISEQLT